MLPRLAYAFLALIIVATLGFGTFHSQPKTQVAQLGDLQSQIQMLYAQIASLQERLRQLVSPTPVPYPSGGGELDCTITTTLHRGSSGSGVSCLQQFLARDPSIYPNPQITGYFGPLTEAAVERFQTKYGIVSYGSPDTTGFGVVGRRTRAMMTEVSAQFGGTLPLPPVPLPQNSFATISASPQSIPSDTPITVTWSSSNVTSCIVSGPGISNAAFSGSIQTPELTQDSTYTITCSKPDGTPLTQSTTVVVTKIPVMPPIVWNRIGIAQNGTLKMTPSELPLLSKVDYIWLGKSGVETPTYTTGYVPYDRDWGLTYKPGVSPPTLLHDYEWYIAHNRADWIMYTCDSVGNPTGPSYYTRYAYGYLMTLNLDNEAVRNYFLNSFIAPFFSAGYEGVAFDNVLSTNRHGYCGGKDAAGKFTRQFLWPAQRVDLAFTTSRVNWMKWMVAHIHPLGGTVSINLSFDERNPSSFDAIASQADVVLQEQGFVSPTDIHYPDYKTIAYQKRCTPVYLDIDWLNYFNSHYKIAKERGLVIFNYACNNPLELTQLSKSEPSASITTWAVANYLLLRGQRTYIAITDAAQGQKYVSVPELHIAIGAPTSDPQKITGTGAWVRYYENGLTIVNPSTTATTTFALPPGVYKDLMGNVVIGSITLPPSRMGKDIDAAGGMHTVPVFGSSIVLLKVK